MCAIARATCSSRARSASSCRARCVAGHEIGDFAGLHGDGVKDISLRVPDANEAYRQAVQRGARGIMEPKVVEDEYGKVALATIATYGDVVHTFVDRHAYEGAYLPGYVAREPSADSGVGLLALDHIVGNVELGRMEHWVEFYERVFGMTEMIHFSDEDISTEYSALMSKVMTDGQGKVKFPINEPAEGKRKSQIEEYLEFNHGPGRAAHRAAVGEHRRDGRGAAAARRALPVDARRVLRRDARSASARSTRAGTTCGGCGSSPTATTTGTCSRSSRRPRRTGRRSSSR